tara:strand:- start:73 stop:630 length:558 start_codon:yes stop_codon:yes gene_type:complete
MTATRELWMLFGTFVLSVLFVCFFIVPNYKSADQASIEGSFLEARIQKLELRQAEVEKMRIDYEDIKQQINEECKLVPSTPDMSKIVQALSLEVDGFNVLDQSFTAGSTTMKQSGEGFSVQPLAVTLHANFSSAFSVIQNVESMNRLVRVSSIRLTRKESEQDITAPLLEAAIGLHAMYDLVEVE